MERRKRIRAIWILTSVALLAAAGIASLLVFAGSGGATLTAEPYADVIRFEVAGATSLEITIYDLAEEEVWNSGVVSGDFVDWDRTNTWGERLANGYYLYLAQAWDSDESLLISKTGRVVLLPGDQVQLASSQRPSSLPDSAPPADDEAVDGQARALTDNPVYGTVRIGTSSTGYKLRVEGDADSGQGVMVRNPNAGTSAYTFFTLMNGASGALQGHMFGASYSNTSLQNKARLRSSNAAGLVLATGDSVPIEFQIDDATQAMLTSAGNLGIGTTSAPAKLTVQGTTGDLIAAYNSSDRVFVVKSTGEVRADGSVYAANFNTGSADVAERINTSEWVEAGDVVEIDPEHPGFFRKSADPYCRRVAGIISTSPGVILGDNSDSEADDWDDNRPVLAIAGRVPVKASAENGQIAVGDLLVSSSIPGVAMRGEPSESVGAVVGKAMEPLEEGEGTIMAQVTLR